MSYEMVGFYPCYGNKDILFATCHVYDTEKQIDIRGINVNCKKNNIKVKLPFCRKYDFEEKRSVGFPVISYTNEQEEMALRSFIAEKAKKEVSSFKFPKGFPSTKEEWIKLLRKNKDINDIKVVEGKKTVYVRK